MVQKIKNSKQLNEEDEVIDRTKLLLSHIEDVGDICSTIRNKIGGQDVDERKDNPDRGASNPDPNKLDLAGNTIRVYVKPENDD